MKKNISLIIVLVLCVSIVGGTLAWMLLSKGNGSGAASSTTSTVSGTSSTASTASTASTESTVSTASTASTTSTASASSAETSSDSSGSAEALDAMLASAFADADYKDVTSETANATITLDGSTGTLSDTTRGSSGSQVTITSKGIYYVTGESDGVSILVEETNKSGNIYLILDNVTMTNTAACIDVEAADKVIIQCVGSSTLTSTATEDAAILSRDDLVINGSGSLALVSSKHGINGKDTVRLTGASLNIESAYAGIKANDAVAVDGAVLEVVSGRDGIQVDSDEGTGYIYLVSGSLVIDAGYDGLDAGTSVASEYTGGIVLAGGTLDITAGGGSDNSKGEDSQKGVKSDGDIRFAGAEVTISSADDAVNSGGDVSLTGGSLELSSSDDGVSATAALGISEGELVITKSYEGLEAETVSISGGSVSVTASDDGVNAAGGSDSSSTEEGPWGSSATGEINISGGTVYVNADGDGLDSNGSIYVSGGTVIVEGPSNSGNGALDKGDGADCVLSITGGTVLALGSTGMAENFDTGTQCSALVTLSGESGDAITVDDGSGFTFTASKSFDCVLYSSPLLEEGSSYTITAGSGSADIDFSSGLYYSDLTAGSLQGQG